MTILIFVFGIIGMTHIIVESDMFLIKFFRDLMDSLLPTFLSKLFHCYMCMGFWVGLLHAYMMFTYFSGWEMFFAACAGSAFANFAAIFYNYLDAQSIINVPEE